MKLALLILWAVSGPQKTKITLTAAALNFLAVFPLCLLSYCEHVFRVSPSLLVELYLLLTIGFDIVRVRTMWFLPGATSLAAMESVALAIKLALAIAEAWAKDGLLQESDKAYTKEQLAGLYGRTLFLWLGRTLWNGTYPEPQTIGIDGPEILILSRQVSIAFSMLRISLVLGTMSLRNYSAIVSDRIGLSVRTNPERRHYSSRCSSPCRSTSSFRPSREWRSWP